MTISANCAPQSSVTPISLGTPYGTYVAKVNSLVGTVVIEVRFLNDGTLLMQADTPAWSKSDTYAYEIIDNNRLVFIKDGHRDGYEFEYYPSEDMFTLIMDEGGQRTTFIFRKAD